MLKFLTKRLNIWSSYSLRLATPAVHYKEVLLCNNDAVTNGVFEKRLRVIIKSIIKA